MEQVNSGGRIVGWVILPFLLLTGPGRATAATPLGTLHGDGEVYLGKEIVHEASVVYSGDHLTTNEGRATVSFPRGMLMLVDDNSAAALEGSPDDFQIGLEKGQLALSLSNPRPVRVETDGLIFSPGGSFPSLTEIALRVDGCVVTAVHRGTMSVANLRPDPVVVTAGQTFTICPTSSRSQGPVGTGAHGKMTLGEKLRTFRIDGLSHTASAALVLVGVGAGVTAAIVVPIAISESPISPSKP